MQLPSTLHSNTLMLTLSAIDSYCRTECYNNNGADFSDLSKIEVAYGLSLGGRSEYHVFVNLKDNSIEYYEGFRLVETDRANSMIELCGWIRDMKFSELLWRAEQSTTKNTGLRESTTEQLLAELSRRNYSTHDLLRDRGYFAYKLWCDDDIIAELLYYGFEPSEENVRIVKSTNMLRCLEDISDDEWGVIDEAILSAEPLLTKK